MSVGSEEISIGPLEPDTVTAEQYAQALARLNNFINLDVLGIKTFEDLSGYGVHVGPDAKAVIQATGTVQVQKMWQGNIAPEVKDTNTVYRQRNIELFFEDHRFIAVPTSRQVLFEAQRKTGIDWYKLYSAAIPLGKPLPDDMPGLYVYHAVDIRDGVVRQYWPERDPTNSNIQQGYARLLQTGLKEMLSFTPPPAQIPSAFQ